MTGDGDEEMGRGDFAEGLRGNGVGAQVNSVGMAGQGDIETVIDENDCAVWIGKLEHGFHVGGELAGGEMFFADLDEFYAGFKGALEGGKRGLIGDEVARGHKAIIEGAGLCWVRGRV